MNHGRDIDISKFRLLIPAVALTWVALGCGAAEAACPVPNQITNGQVADASQVMDNFTTVANCATSITGSPASGSLATISGPTSVGGGDLSGDVSTSGDTIATLAPSGVTPGTYVSANITVDAKGRVTAAANGSGTGGSGMTLIERRVITSDTPSTTFSSLGSFLDLIIYVEGRTSDASTRYLMLTFNGDTSASDYFFQILTGSNTTVSTAVTATQVGCVAAGLTPSGALANMFGSGRVEILDYTGSHLKSSVANYHVMGGTAPTTQIIATVGSVWKSTAPITSLTFTPVAGNIAAGSVISVYGR